MAYGDIGAIIDSLEFDASSAAEPILLNVSGDIFAIAYNTAGTAGVIKTMSIDGDGNVGAGAIDSFVFDSVRCYTPAFIHVLGDIFAIAYSGPDADGFLVTVSIDADGNIGAAVIDSFEFDAVGGYSPDIVHVFGDVYAIAYLGYYSDGLLVTIGINEYGNIDAAVIDSFEFDGAKGDHPFIIHVSGNVYAIAYVGADNDGWMKTVSIGISGNIGAAAIDSFEFDVTQGTNPEIIHVSGDVFAIIYTDSTTAGLLKTVSINEAGNIGAAVVDSFVLDSVDCNNANILHVSGGVFAIAYNGPDSDGWLKTVSIDADGNIGASVIDSFEFDGLFGLNPSILHVSGDVYAIAYKGPDADGFLITLDISTQPVSNPKYLTMMGVG